MKMNIGKLILGSALAMALTLPIGKATFGDRDWSNDCHKRLEADRARIDHDVSRHGERSPQVDHDRDRLEADRSWCKNHHAEWDHDRFDLGVYIKH
jgi:hypothetical protein